MAYRDHVSVDGIINVLVGRGMGAAHGRAALQR